MTSTSHATITVTCPCGASLTVEASTKVCAERQEDFTKGHRGHRAPAPVVYRDRWYPPYAPYTPIYASGGVITTNTGSDLRFTNDSVNGNECHIVKDDGTMALSSATVRSIAREEVATEASHRAYRGRA